MPDRDAVAGDDRAHVETGGDLGQTLRAARNAKGLTLEEISAELRIEVHQLAALEQCRFTDIGPPVFVKGYLRHYGNRLGLEYKDLLAAYYRLVEPQEFSIAPSRTIKLHDERQVTMWVLAALVIGLLGVFLFVWIVDEPPVTAPTADSVAPQPDLSPPADAGSGLPLPDETEEPVFEPAEPVETPVAETADQAAEPAPETAGAAPVGPAPAAAAPGLPGVQGAPGARPVPAVRIDIVFAEDSWVAVTDGRGARLYYGLGRAGERSSLTGEAPVDVLIGNTAGVELTVDGNAFEVPSEAREGNLARFTLDGDLD
jgi:cytoskeleton protein RodZ